MGKEDNKFIGYFICKAKRRYLTRRKAWKAALYFYIHFGHAQHPYKCAYCKKYHLTSKHVTEDGLAPEFKEGFNEWFGAPIFDLTPKT